LCGSLPLCPIEVFSDLSESHFIGSGVATSLDLSDDELLNLVAKAVW
jgi:hypothetical protein